MSRTTNFGWRWLWPRREWPTVRHLYEWNLGWDIDKPWALDTGTTADCTTILTALQAGTLPDWSASVMQGSVTVSVVGQVSIPITKAGCLRLNCALRHETGTAQGPGASTNTIV